MPVAHLGHGGAQLAPHLVGIAPEAGKNREIHITVVQPAQLMDGQSAGCGRSG